MNPICEGSGRREYCSVAEIVCRECGRDFSPENKKYSFGATYSGTVPAHSAVELVAGGAKKALRFAVNVVLAAFLVASWGCAPLLHRKPAPVWVCGTFNGHSISFDLSEPFHLENDPAKSPKVAIDFHLCAPGEREALRTHGRPKPQAAAAAESSCRSETCGVTCLPGFVARCDYGDTCFCQPDGVVRIGVLSEDSTSALFAALRPGEVATRPSLVSVVVRDGTVGDLLASVARQAGVTLEADVALEEHPISAELQSARLSDVLDNLCEAYSCRWTLSGSELRVVAGCGR